ncbi:hypothetical protein AVEN_177829-1 [Araneus ventricosus]|uniref:Uncharacterized protein n=1 Tax=Araneus ventricosus TaxID=182803 RepID=A0A4Y2L750_ARAVE|nr:hypothetical protein AVEN_177829-1 [Araneus ventricosus]
MVWASAHRTKYLHVMVTKTFIFAWSFLFPPKFSDLNVKRHSCDALQHATGRSYIRRQSASKLWKASQEVWKPRFVISLQTFSPEAKQSSIRVMYQFVVIVRRQVAYFG